MISKADRMKKEPAPKAATPAIQIFISDSAWPLMEILVVTESGREYPMRAAYDIAQSQFQVPVMNALREALAGAIQARKDGPR